VKTVDSGFGSPVAGRSGEARLSSSSLTRSLAGIVRAIVYFGGGVPVGSPVVPAFQRSTLRSYSASLGRIRCGVRTASPKR
jgi:hypothetical protein